MISVVVTGAAHGLGAAIVRRIAAPDVHVVATDIDGEGLERLAARIPFKITTYTGDVQDPSSHEGRSGSGGGGCTSCMVGEQCRHRSAGCSP